MKLDIIIPRLTKPSKPYRSASGMTIRACCPVCCGGNRTKLVVTEKADGAVLMHCFGEGCDALEIASSIGIEIAFLFPDGQRTAKPIRANARHGLEVLAMIAAEIAEETEFAILQHAREPIHGINQILVTNALRMREVKEHLMEKGDAK